MSPGLTLIISAELGEHCSDLYHENALCGLMYSSVVRIMMISSKSKIISMKAAIYDFTMHCGRQSYLLKKHCFYVCGTTRSSLSKNILNRKAGTGRPVHTSAPWSALLCLWQLPVHGLAQESPVLGEVTVWKRGFFCITYKTPNSEKFELSRTNAWKLQRFAVEEFIAGLMNQPQRLWYVQRNKVKTIKQKNYVQ